MRYTKGQSGNPVGRPRGSRGISAYIAEKTNGYRELIDGLLDLARDPQTSSREKLGAYQALLDRGIGRPMNRHEILSMSMNLTPLPAGFESLPYESKMRILDEYRAAALANPQDDDQALELGPAQDTDGEAP